MKQILIAVGLLLCSFIFSLVIIFGYTATPHVGLVVGAFVVLFSGTSGALILRLGRLYHFSGNEVDDPNRYKNASDFAGGIALTGSIFCVTCGVYTDLLVIFANQQPDLASWVLPVLVGSSLFQNVLFIWLGFMLLKPLLQGWLPMFPNSKWLKRTNAWVNR
ncbi:MAG: hypothetical protein LKJ69_04770 [Lactobacillus sp.]|jgi:hypothetical protein|nr:hypothetical protein [Lactobacillus sp.]MCI2032696.1 hypothetical protein [Lactobacillus sp.]